MPGSLGGPAAALGAVEGRNLDMRGLNPDLGAPGALLLAERLVDAPDVDHGRCVPAEGLQLSPESPASAPRCGAKAKGTPPSVLLLLVPPSNAVACSCA